MAKMYPFDVPWRSKACREKSAEVIVPKTRVSMGKDRIAQCNSKWLLPLRLFCSQMSERSFPTHHDRTESDNRVGVTLVRGMAENNLPHIVRWESAKPPYAEPLVRWCGRSVNVKVGGKCLSMISIYLLPDYILECFRHSGDKNGAWYAIICVFFCLFDINLVSLSQNLRR